MITFKKYAYAWLRDSETKFEMCPLFFFNT